MHLSEDFFREGLLAIEVEIGNRIRTLPCYGDLDLDESISVKKGM
jgi:hypothetical protein